MSEQNKNGGAAFGATAESRAITHADNCWSWGAKHYKCAVREIRAKRAEVAAWRELSDRMEAVLDQLQAEIERLRAELEGWKEQHARDSAELRRICQHRDEYKARAERLAEALEDIRSRSSMNLAMNSDPFELTARLGDIYQIADAMLKAREGGQ